MRGAPVATAAVALPVMAFLAAYGPDAGHGFIKDDFGWILDSRASNLLEIGDFFRTSSGFYRPIVTLSFAANYAASGVDPRPYGLTNLLLALACGAALYALARALGLQRWASLLAGGLWAFNFHGVNMGVLWISGRTSLLLTLLTLLAATAFVKGRPAAAVALTFVALLSKEEAVALPPILLVWTLVDLRSPESRVTASLNRSAAILALLLVPLLAYFVLRYQSSAMLPSTAPPFYRFTFSPATVFDNAVEYVDRAVTFPAVVALLVWASTRRSLALSDRERTIVLFGLTWLILGYSLTLFLPVRSSLYACFPSAGAALAAAVVIGNLAERLTAVTRRRAAIAALLLPLALWPVYHARNERWVSLADFSTAILDDFQPLIRSVDEGATILVVDDRGPRANISSAFGNFLPTALFLQTGKRVNVIVHPPLPGEEPQEVRQYAMKAAVRQGRLVQAAE
jgi:hypothetical protein